MRVSAYLLPQISPDLLVKIYCLLVVTFCVLAKSHTFKVTTHIGIEQGEVADKPVAWKVYTLVRADWEEW